MRVSSIVTVALLCACVRDDGVPADSARPSGTAAPIVDSPAPVDTAAAADTATVDTTAVDSAPPTPGRDPWIEAAGRGIEMRALGQEPGWYAEVDEGGTMVIVWDYMERRLSTPSPAPRREAGRTTYETATDSGRVTLVFHDRPCSDAMSGRPFPLTVELRIGDRRLDGCGMKIESGSDPGV